MSFLMRVKGKHESNRFGDAASGGFVPAMDRRQEPRCRADRRQAVSAQLLGGVDVKLCNVSTRGVMFESSMRVLVGARVTLRLRTSARTVLLPGEVVRSRVSATRHGRLRYETALCLESDCPLTNEELTIAPQHAVVSVVDMNVVDVEVVDAEPAPRGGARREAVRPDQVHLVSFPNEWGSSAPRR